MVRRSRVVLIPVWLYRAHLAPRSVHHARIHAVVLCGHRGEADAIRTCGTLRAGVSGVTFGPLRALWPRLALDAPLVPVLLDLPSLPGDQRDR